MNARDCLRLGIGNAFAAWPRFLALALLAMVVTLATAWAGPRAFQQFLLDREAATRSGDHVLVARSTQHIDGTACDRLARVAGIARAGAVGVAGSFFEIRPGVRVSWWRMTPGFRTLVLDDESGGSAPDGMLIGGPLARELALGPGSAVTRPNASGARPVGVLRSHGARTEPFDRSALVVTNTTYGYDQCWVEVGRGSLRAATAVVTATFAPSNPDVQVGTLVFRPSRATTPEVLVVALAGGLVLGLANGLFCLLRRIDAALLGLLGVDFRRRCLVVGSELLAAILTGAASAAVALLGWMAMSGPASRPALAATAEFFVTAMATCAAVTCLALALVSAPQWFTVLRDA